MCEEARMELVTERLVLRELEESDAEAAHEYERDEDVVRYQTDGVRTLDESRAYIARVRAETALQAPRLLFDLAITLRRNEQYVGRVGLNVTSLSLREATLWYVLNPRFHGQGLVPEAARALVDHGFRELDLHRLYVDCDPRNTASIRVAEKLGLRREAHFVENALIKGEWCDSVIYAMLDREWRARAPALKGNR